MDLKQYQQLARRTAIYKQIPNSKIIYPAIGLIGECGEVAEKTKKLIRDDNWNMTDKRKTAITKELGDILWYCANICWDIDLDLEMMYEMRGYGITQQIKALMLLRLILHLNRHANIVAQELEKWYFEDKSQPNAFAKHQTIPYHLSHILTCINEIGCRLGYTLEDICKTNIENLAGRQNRGTLHGDGDNR